MHLQRGFLGPTGASQKTPLIEYLRRMKVRGGDVHNRALGDEILINNAIS